MKSIQTKILVLILAVIILCSVVIGGNSIYFVHRSSDQNSAQIMNLICQEEGRKIDHIFHSIEQSVKILAYSMVQNVNMVKTLSSQSQQQKYMEELRGIVLAAAESADGAVAVYVHFNPEIAPSDAGLLYAKKDVDGAFFEQQPTDLAEVEDLEAEEFAWYTKPAREGKASWIGPYHNGKTEGLIMTYVTPVYENHILVGVVGMDIHMSRLLDIVENIKVYETGHAALVESDHTMLYHASEGDDFPIADIAAWDKFMEEVRRGQQEESLFEFFYRGADRKCTFTDLEAGMYLMISAPKGEIDAKKTELINSTLTEVVLISIFCLLISLFVSRGIVGPLKEITRASRQIAEGNLQVTLETRSRDEVGVLAGSLQRTVDCLRVYMEQISDVAYTDALTGVKSKAAYKEEVRRLNHSIENGFTQLGIIMFDLNNLKMINDKYGHEAGDTYIVNGCRLICNVFKRSPVFRIGGDEFVVILSGKDLLNVTWLLKRFYEKMEEKSRDAKRPQDGVSISAGIAVFQEGQDRELQDVFKRADAAMYRNKEAMKKGLKPMIEDFEIT